LKPLSAEQHDAPLGVTVDEAVLDEWSRTAHARNGVNCTACHIDEVDGRTDAAATGDGAADASTVRGVWTDRPSHGSCTTCHAKEVEGFLGGKHGMRLNVAANGIELPPMTPGAARLPMQPAAGSLELGCGSCHGAHRFDAAAASVDGCLGCHDDEHTLAYPASPHGQLWARAQAGELAAASAVTCATCHMPRSSVSYNWGEYSHVLVQHNQSDNLKPNDKMLRPVCSECHGLGFSIDALADPRLIRNNFNGPPTVHVESLALAEQRKRAVELERQRDAAPSQTFDATDSTTTEGNAR
jgi:hypothetical protein